MMKYSAALYQLVQGTYSPAANRDISINGNHIEDYFNYNTAADTVRYYYINSKQVTSNTPIATTWFCLNAGDVVTIRMKDVWFRNDYLGSGTTNRIDVKDTSNNTLVSVSVMVPNRQTKTWDVVENTVTMTEDVDVSCLLIWLNRKSLIYYDLELEVNGKRYL